MGFVFTIDLGNGDRIIEIDGEKNIAFLDYDIVYDLACEEFKYPPTRESEFYRRFEEDGIEIFINHSRWLETLVGAIMANPKGAIEAGLSKEDIARMLLCCTTNDPDEQDYRDEIVELVGEDKLVEWLAKAIEEKLGEKYTSISDLTDLIEPYITKENIEVGENIWYKDGESWENTKVGDYSVTINDEEIAKWRVIAMYRIYDPVGFGGDVDSEFTEDRDENIDGEMRIFLARFDLKLKEFTDPEPPDHPEVDENGPFAVIYKLSAEHFNQRGDEDEIIVVRYKDIWDADNAMELSGYILDRDGDSDFVEMAILRRPTPDELEIERLKEHEREMLRRQGALFEAEKEPEDEREDWEDEWVRMTEDEVKEVKHEEFKKKYGYSPSW